MTDTSNNRKRRILHVVAGDENWVPTQGQLNEIQKLFDDANKCSTDTVVTTREGIVVYAVSEYDEVKARAFQENFNSTDDKRVDNNPKIEDVYTGPDDVALQYKVLEDADKAKMLQIKTAAQNLINELRALGSHRDIDLAIEHAQDSSMRGVRFLTQSSKQ